MSISLVLAAVLFALPVYAMFSTSTPSGDTLVSENMSLNNPYEVTESSIVGEYDVDMWEDLPISINLDGYLHIDWDYIETTSSTHIYSYVSGYDLILTPAENWFGTEEISVTAQYWQSGDNFTVIFNVTVQPVNDSPGVYDNNPYLLETTTLTDINMPDPWDLNQFFYDVDSELSYSWNSLNGLSSIAIENDMVVSVSTGTMTGDDTVTITASDGEYSSSVNFFLSIYAKQTLPMVEDTRTQISLENLYDLLTHEYEIFDSPHISSKANDVVCDFIPEQDWFGHENVGIYISPIVWSILPPPPSDSISSAPGDSVNPPEPTYVEYAYYEFMAEVSPVNDQPVVISQDAYLFSMTTYTTFPFESPFDMNSIFEDVDNDLSFSWTSKYGLVFPTTFENNIYSLTSYDKVGTDIITLYAYDGEYVVSYDIYVSMQSREQISMDEDIAYQINLDDYVDPLNEKFYMENSDRINTIEAVSDSGVGTVLLDPAINWFGTETLALYTEPLINSINPPYVDQPMSAPPGDSISPPEPAAIEFGYYNFDVMVHGVNDPPVMADIPSIELYEDQDLYGAFDIDDYFSDVDSQLTFSVEMLSASSDVEAVLQFDNSVNIFPGRDWFGTETLRVTATDGEYTLTQDVGVNVLPVNDVPFVSDMTELIVFEEDTTVSLNFGDYIHDVDDALWFSCSYDENNVSVILNETTWDATFVPKENWNGQASVIIYGSDGEYQLARELQLNVTAVNDAPVIISTAGQSFGEDGTLILDMNAYFDDVDSELAFRAFSNSGELNTEMVNGKTLIIESTLPDWNGATEITLFASDGEFLVDLTLPVNVLPVNDAPVSMELSAPVMMKEDISMSIDLDDLFHDVDGDALSYYFSNNGNVLLMQNEDLNRLDIIPAENWNGEFSIRIIASDGSASATNTISVNVEPVDDPPVFIQSSGPVLAYGGDTVTIDLNDYFSDMDTTALEFSISGYENIEVAETGTPGVYSLTIPQGWDGMEALTVSATDGTSTVESQIHVNSPYTMVEAAPQDASVFQVQSVFWMGVGIIVAIAGMAIATTTRKHRASRRIPAGRDSIL